MIQRAVDEFGQIDFLIANAGILRDKSFKNMTNDMWDIVIDVHLRGTYLTVKVVRKDDRTGKRRLYCDFYFGLIGNLAKQTTVRPRQALLFARCCSGRPEVQRSR